MRGLLRRLCCWWRTGHAPAITYLESLNGRLFPIREVCTCGAVKKTCWPGGLFSAFKEAYADYPGEWQEWQDLF